MRGRVGTCGVRGKYFAGMDLAEEAQGWGPTKSSTERARRPADGGLRAHSDTGDLGRKPAGPADGGACGGAHSGTGDLQTGTWGNCRRGPVVRFEHTAGQETCGREPCGGKYFAGMDFA